MAIFDDPLAAEAFLLTEDFGAGWETLDNGAREASTLLEGCILNGVEYVALNPPSRPLRGRGSRRLILIELSVKRLRTNPRGCEPE